MLFTVIIIVLKQDIIYFETKRYLYFDIGSKIIVVQAF